MPGHVAAIGADYEAVPLVDHVTSGRHTLDTVSRQVTPVVGRPVTVTPPADFDVVVIGAGIVGINAGIKKPATHSAR